MASVRNNGGGCCGAYHIAGFSDTDARDVASLEDCLTRIPTGRLTEIILNQGQMNAKPLLLAKMAEVGFVLTDSWINNNHQSRLYRFSLCDRRHRIDQIGGRARWPGQVIEPSMRGDYPQRRRDRRQQAQQNYDAAVRRWEQWRPPFNPRREPGEIRTGDIVEVNSPRSSRHGRQFRVEGYPVARYLLNWTRVPMRDRGTPFSIVRSNLQLITPVAAVVVERPPRPERPAILDEPVAEPVPRRHEVG